MLPPRPRLNRRLRLRFSSAHNDWVLGHGEGRFRLNQSAAEILRRCDGHHQLDDIVDELQALFEVEGIHGQITALLGEAVARGWIE